MDFNNTTVENSLSHEINAQDHRGVHIVTYVFSVLCTLWTLGTNSVILGCFYRARKRPWSIFSRLACSMSVSDLMVGMTTIPFHALWLYDRYVNGILCFSIFYFFFAFQSVTIYHVLGICIFRNIKLKYVSEQINETKYKIHSYIVIVASWTSAIALVFLPFVIWNKTSDTNMFCLFPNVFGSNFRVASVFLALVYFIPQLLTNVIYAMTYYRFRSTNRIAPAPNDPLENRPYPSTSRQTQERYKVFYVSSPRGQTTLTSIGHVASEPFTSFTPSKNKNPKYSKLHLDVKRQHQVKQLVSNSEQETKNTMVMPRQTSRNQENLRQNIQSTSTKQNKIKVDTRRNMQTNSAEIQKQLLVTIGILLFLFNVLTVPTTIAMFVISSTPSPTDSNVLVANLFVINSGINAIVYTVRVKSLRDDVKALFRKCARAVCCCISHIQ